MTRDDIIRMAEAAGGHKNVYDVHPPAYGPMILDDAALERFARLVAAAERKNTAINGIHSCHSECQRPACVAVREAMEAEREECAKLCDEMGASSALSYLEKYRTCFIADAIRERGKP